MSVVCEVCGDVGYKDLLLHCNRCKYANRHRGIMKIGRDYISLAAHVSTKACEKVWELSRFLPQIMKVTELSTLKAWPKSWEASKPTADSIGLYFFSDAMRPNKELNQLVKYVADCGIVLKTVVGFAKLLIFSSVVLAEEYQVFKGKHYLWGVFMRVKGRRRRSAPAKQDCTAHVAEEEQVQEQQQDKGQCDTLDQELPVVEQKRMEGVKKNRRSFKDHTPVKMQRSTEANEDENAVVGDHNAGCAQNDNSQLASQTAVTDHCGQSRTPLISGYICVQPIDKPCWTGIMKIGRDYISLAAHVSTKACEKVWELTRFLPQIMKVTELSTLKAWPKSWEASKPTADSIGLYFFSDTMRPNKELDQLVKYVADCGIALKTVVGFAKLLIFSSVVLAEEYQVFKGKHYLWGVFMRVKHRRRRSAPAKQDCTANVAEEEHVQEQQDKGQCDALDQEMPVVEHVVHSECQPLLDANQDVGKWALSGNGQHSAEMNSPRVQSNCFQEFTCLPYQNSRHALVSASISPADRGQPCSNSEARPPKLFGFVVARTPRSAQLIQEMENEGALLFAVQ